MDWRRRGCGRQSIDRSGLVVALITVFSRVVLGRHYVLNVFFGACFGVLEAVFIVHFLKFHVLDLIGGKNRELE
ncbi:Phosphatidic acid phosphatase type 2/haloperoxidase superfamily [Sesbania bispinosa]|nr:Phosphatidic acid phosphatase type 2/haloperoxidase superfamily [Sesbania bispinosa]